MLPALSRASLANFIVYQKQCMKAHVASKQSTTGFGRNHFQYIHRILDDKRLNTATHQSIVRRFCLHTYIGCSCENSRFEVNYVYVLTSIIPTNSVVCAIICVCADVQCTTMKNPHNDKRKQREIPNIVAKYTLIR